LPAQTQGKITDIDHLLNLPEPFLQTFAHLVRYQGPQVVLIFAKDIPKLSDNITPFGRRHRPPKSEGLLCLLNNAVVVARRHLSDGPYQLIVYRRNAFKQMASQTDTAIAPRAPGRVLTSNTKSVDYGTNVNLLHIRF